MMVMIIRMMTIMTTIFGRWRRQTRRWQGWRSGAASLFAHGTSRSKIIIITIVSKIIIIVFFIIILITIHLLKMIMLLQESPIVGPKLWRVGEVEGFGKDFCRRKPTWGDLWFFRLNINVTTHHEDLDDCKPAWGDHWFFSWKINMTTHHED